MNKKIKKFKGFLAFFKRCLIQLKTPALWRYIYNIFWGFTPNKGLLYDFENYHRGDYLTDYWRYVHTHEINKNYTYLFNDKLINYFFLKNYTKHVVPIIGYIERGYIYEIEIKEDFMDCSVILKDKNGWGGYGVFKGHFHKGEIEVDGKKVSIRNFNNYIIVPWLENHLYARAIYPNTLNTIRILTGVWNNEIIAIGCVHRFGNQKTGNVDNFSSGGISAEIDIESGKIVSAVYRDNIGKKRITEIHPFTKQKIVGVLIPDWNTIVDYVKELHNKISFVRYIAWDIAVTPTNFYIIETNHISDIDVFQVHKPLLLLDTVIDFYNTQF